MNILVIGINYIPEKTAIGPFTAELCEYLEKKGNNINVITSFPHYPEWKIKEEYKGKLFKKELINGVKLIRSYVYLPKKPSIFLERIKYDCSFTLSSFISSLSIKSYDVIIAISPPLELGFIGWFLSRYRGAPFLLQIKDLIPDTAVDLGIMKNKKAINFAYKIEKFIYDRASAIGVISKGFKEKIQSKGIKKEKIYLLPDWIDTDFMKPSLRDNEFRKRNNLKSDDLLVMYAGNIGNKQDFEIIISTAILLKDYHDIKFFIVGEGERKIDLINKTQKLNMNNIKFLDFQPRQLLPYMFSSADVMLIPQKANVKDICMPSKLLYIMASATPLVASVNNQSETAKTINDAKSGLVVEPENPVILSKAILKLKKSKRMRQNLGKNGRNYVINNYEKNKVLKKFEILLIKLVKNNQ